MSRLVPDQALLDVLLVEFHLTQKFVGKLDKADWRGFLTRGGRQRRKLW